MDPLLSMIVIFGCNFNPRGWMTCSGQLLSIAQNTALFSLLGTTYGGDGVTTFALPDLRGRIAVGVGQGLGLSNYSLGEVGGSESNTLNVNQMPVHNHTATATSTSSLFAESTTGSLNNPNGKMLASGTSIFANEDPANNRQMSSQSVTTATTVTVNANGGSQPVPNLQPFLAMNYCIATEGIFPSRN